jgi:hypothetical protein
MTNETSPLETNKRTAGDDLHSAAASGSTPKFYTRKEAATYLTKRGHMVGHKTLANWASEKKGPRFKKSSGKAIYECSDLDDWCSARSRAGDNT